MALHLVKENFLQASRDCLFMQHIRNKGLLCPLNAGMKTVGEGLCYMFHNS